MFTIAEHAKNVLENTLMLSDFVSEHWLASSSFVTSWAIGWSPAKTNNSSSAKKVSSAFARFWCNFYISSSVWFKRFWKEASYLQKCEQNVTLTPLHKGTWLLIPHFIKSKFLQAKQKLLQKMTPLIILFKNYSDAEKAKAVESGAWIGVTQSVS